MNNDKLVELQMMEQQINALNQNLQNIENNIDEINTILTTLDDFKKLKKGDKILVPVTNGVFAEAILENTNDLKVNVGSNVIVKKDVEGAKKLMGEQLVELEKYKEETTQYFSDMNVKLQELQGSFMAEQAKSEKK